MGPTTGQAGQGVAQTGAPPSSASLRSVGRRSGIEASRPDLPIAVVRERFIVGVTGASWIGGSTSPRPATPAIELLELSAKLTNRFAQLLQLAAQLAQLPHGSFWS